MSPEFSNVKVDDLTDAQCRELLKTIEDLVGNMPSYIEHDRDGGYGRIYDPYCCRSGYTNQGHDKNCSIGQLKLIFGY